MLLVHEIKATGIMSSGALSPIRPALSREVVSQNAVSPQALSRAAQLSRGFAQTVLQLAPPGASVQAALFQQTRQPDGSVQVTQVIIRPQVSTGQPLSAVTEIAQNPPARALGGGSLAVQGSVTAPGALGFTASQGPTRFLGPPSVSPLRSVAVRSRSRSQSRCAGLASCAAGTARSSQSPVRALSETMLALGAPRAQQDADLQVSPLQSSTWQSLGRWAGFFAQHLLSFIPMALSDSDIEVDAPTSHTLRSLGQAWLNVQAYILVHHLVVADDPRLGPVHKQVVELLRRTHSIKQQVAQLLRDRAPDTCWPAALDHMIGEVDAVLAFVVRSLVEPPNPDLLAAEVQYWLLRHDPEVAAFAECIVPYMYRQRGLPVPAAIRQAMTATADAISVILKDVRGRTGQFRPPAPKAVARGQANVPRGSNGPDTDQWDRKAAKAPGRRRPARCQGTTGPVARHAAA